MINMLLTICISLIAIPVLIFSIEVLFSLMPYRKTKINHSTKPTYTILIPAHNESGIIQKTLERICEQLTENGSVLVVADNCTDDTALVAKQYPIEVIEREHAINRGKGFALDYGIKYIEASKPDVVIIIDADCMIEVGTLKKLATAAIIYNKPIQALYLMKYINPSLKQRISEFAWLVKNYVRPLGLANMGLPCQLMGSGMAFPWSVISKVTLASSNIVEDMKMGLDMAMAGHAPVFLPTAQVTSLFPETKTAEQSQKKRWEHGHLNIMVTVLPKTFVLSVIRFSKDTFAMGLDMLVPPLALLTLLNILLFMTTLGLFVFYEMENVFLLSLIMLFILMSSILIAWAKWGRATITFFDLLSVPFYIVGKIPLYVSAVFKRQKEWIRTDRD